MVGYDIKSIPTVYKARQYRSRLEARWACMLDLLIWKHEYESIDLNGWFPDFSLFGEKHMLCEVKPFTELDEFAEEIEKIKIAIKGTKFEGTEILLLGCQLFQDELSGVPLLGWLGTPWDVGGQMELVFDHAQLNYYQNKWGFFAANNSYMDRMTGLYNGNEYVDIPWFDDAEELWVKAGNEVQWKKPKAKKKNTFNDSVYDIPF